MGGIRPFPTRNRRTEVQLQIRRPGQTFDHVTRCRINQCTLECAPGARRITCPKRALTLGHQLSNRRDHPPMIPRNTCRRSVGAAADAPPRRHAALRASSKAPSERSERVGYGPLSGAPGDRDCDVRLPCPIPRGPEPCRRSQKRRCRTLASASTPGGLRCDPHRTTNRQMVTRPTPSRTRRVPTARSRALTSPIAHRSFDMRTARKRRMLAPGTLPFDGRATCAARRRFGKRGARRCLTIWL